MNLCLSKSRKARLIAVGSALAMFAAGSPAFGQTSLKSYPVQGFDRITIRIPATVGIIQADQAKVQITAEPKVLDRLLVTERDRTLIIEAPGGFSTTQPLSVAISALDLRKVTLEAAGDITINRPRGRRLDLHASGAGSMHVNDAEIGMMAVQLDGAGTARLSGRASGLYLQLSGASTVDAGALRAARVTVNVEGAGEVLIHADESIDATVSGSGSVRYQGTAVVKRRVSGAGLIERR